MLGEIDADLVHDGDGERVRLALAGPGNLVIAAVCVVVSNFFFCTGCDLVAAFLPELARGRDLGKVSGWGWSLASRWVRPL